MENTKNEVRKICQNCDNYDRCAKKCGISGKYTARKNSCEKNFKEGK